MDDKTGSSAESDELILELNRNYALSLPERLPLEELEILLADRLNSLIRSDFNALIVILYRIDVSEEKLKKLLRDSPGEDAGRIMARLIIERQLQKIKG